MPSSTGQPSWYDIGRVLVRTAEPIVLSRYAEARRTGSSLLIGPVDGATLTARMAGGSG
ncbi:hypothetical protein [Streptomyces sp. enrichment culture]|uniref:hypothetical protein n=1 Tax=Streptomyces sp. enrichment culture TaxID=1795815 RepID=UPI003F565ECA